MKIDTSGAAAETGHEIGISLDDLASQFTLESVKGYGPQKFKELHSVGLRPQDVLDDPNLLPTQGLRGDAFRSAITRVTAETKAECRRRAMQQITTAQRLSARILTYNHPHYPLSVYESNNPIPVLYARGNLELMHDLENVACVGSRNLRPPYSELHVEFAQTAARINYTIVSGFALGADTAGHEEAFRAGSRTICVMPAGLDRPFPPENRTLWEQLLTYTGAIFVSEFPFGIRASALTLRKRNKLIVAFARGVLVSQSAADGGAMNAYRFAREQRKPVATFESDGTLETSGNRLIIEESKEGDATFPGKPDQEAYKRWLQELSSST